MKKQKQKEYIYKKIALHKHRKKTVKQKSKYHKIPPTTKNKQKNKKENFSANFETKKKN